MPSASAAARELARAIDRRQAAERRPSYRLYVLAPMALLAAGTLAVAGLAWGRSGPGAAWDPLVQALGLTGAPLPGGGAELGLVLAQLGLIFLAGLSQVLILYQLIHQRNEHLARDRELRRALLDWLRAQRTEDGEAARGDGLLARMERHAGNARETEDDRWVVPHLVGLLFVPLWKLYIVGFLMRDPAEHARRQARFVDRARELLDASEERLPGIEPIRRRSLLSLALLLVPVVGWVVLMRWVMAGWEEHFDRQRRFEEGLRDLAVGSTGGEPPLTL